MNVHIFVSWKAASCKAHFNVNLHIWLYVFEATLPEDYHVKCVENVGLITDVVNWTSGVCVHVCVCVHVRVRVLAVCDLFP